VILIGAEQTASEIERRLSYTPSYLTRLFSGQIELRYMSASADIQDGDRLVTSGIDGTYPAGFPVGTVIHIERDAATAFARIVCQPAAGVGRGRYVLVLTNEMKLPPYPEEADEAKGGRADKARRARKKDGDGGTR